MTDFIVFDSSTGTVQRAGSALNSGDVALQPVAAGQTIKSGVSGRPGLDRWNGSAVVALAIQAPTLAALKSAALSALADRRWQVETGGITFAGHKLATDDRSKLLVSDAARRAEADSSFTTKWKACDGWATFAASDLIAARNAIFAHVAACFDREAALAAQIAAAANEAALAALDPAVRAFWPA